LVFTLSMVSLLSTSRVIVLPVRVFTKICILKQEALQTRRDKIKRTPNLSKISATRRSKTSKQHRA
jgi:hypothetical protein